MGKRSIFETLPDKTRVRTLTDVVKLVENDLGWSPPWDDPRPLWKLRSIEVSKLKRTIARLEREKRSRKGIYTVANLARTVAYLKAKRAPVKSPAHVAYSVEHMLSEQAEAEVVSLDGERIQRALRQVEVADLAESERETWRRRLTRAMGESRVEVVHEWEQRHG